MNPLDRLWRLADRFAFVHRAGTDAVSTQWHHALVCALGAALGAVTALAFHLPPMAGAVGVYTACWLAYVARELAQHRGRAWPWDAYGDVLLPFCWGLVGLAGGTRQLVIWLAVSLALGAFYTVLRPVRAEREP